MATIRDLIMQALMAEETAMLTLDFDAAVLRMLSDPGFEAAILGQSSVQSFGGSNHPMTTRLLRAATSKSLGAMSSTIDTPDVEPPFSGYINNADRPVTEVRIVSSTCLNFS